MGVSDQIFLFGTLFPDMVRKFWPSCGRYLLTSKRNPRCVYTASLCSAHTYTSSLPLGCVLRRCGRRLVTARPSGCRGRLTRCRARCWHRPGPGPGSRRTWPGLWTSCRRTLRILLLINLSVPINVL